MFIKRIVLFSVIGLGINASFAQNKKTINNTDIEGVKVFLNNAQIARSAKVNIDAGVTTLSFTNLSSYINQQSISVSGSGNFTILSVQYQLDYLEQEKKSAEVKLLQDSLKTYTYKADELNAKKQVLDQEEVMVLSNKSIGGSNVGVSLDNLTKVADFFRSRLTEIKTNLLKLSVQEKTIADKLTSINDQLNNLNNTGDKPSGNIIVNVKTDAKTAADIELVYLVNEAGWSPIYDIRAKDIKSPIQLAYKANVHQSTGEDWKNVKLTISTGNPSEGGTKPELLAWYLNFNKLRVISYAAPLIMMDKDVEDTDLKVKGGRSDAQTYYIDGVKKKVSSIAESVTASQNQLSTDFNISIPYSLPSDGKKVLVDVQNYSLNADYKYYSTPKLDQDVFLVANVTGWADLSLLSGSANVYFDGTYIGESHINMDNANDTLALSLGRDKKINVKREKLKEYSSTKIFSDKKQKDLSYEITLKNNKKEAITVVLEDQIPISQNKDIEVKTNEISGANYNTETGKLTWVITLEPAAEVKKKFSFSVKYPANQNIPNL